jgi:putative ABC transport system permease protein
MLHRLWSDITRAVRSLARTPGFAFAVILTLGLGLGTNAAIFSFLDRVFLRYPEGVGAPQQLRRLWREEPASRGGGGQIDHFIAYHEYEAIAAAVGATAQLASYMSRPAVPIGLGDDPARVTAVYATASYFPTLGARLAIGRPFTDAEARVTGASPVAVVSYDFWHTHLGGNPGAVGSTVVVDDRPFTIIGVADRGFSGVDLERADLWLPMGMFPTRETARVPFWRSVVVTVSIIARVPPGTSDRVLESRATRGYRLAPVTDFAPDSSATIYARSIIDAAGPGPRPHELSIAMRLAAVAIIILLIAAANVVNLLFARAISRRREIAIRLALGIGRARLMRMFVIESTLLSLGAGAAALASATITAGVLRSILLPGTHVAGGAVSWRVVAFTLVLSLVTGLLAGILPARRAAHTDLTSSLKAGGRESGVGRSATPNTLVGIQAALAVMLLVGAGAFVTSLLNFERLSVGFDVPRLGYATLQLPAGERADTLGFAAAMRQVYERLAGAPGVEAIAYASDPPLMGMWGRVKFYTSDDSSEAPGRELPTAIDVSSTYFATVGLHFTRGTTFTDQRGQSSDAVVVNEALAETYWPHRDAIGQCISIQSASAPCLRVTGVVGNAIRERIGETPEPQLYLPIFASVRGQRPPRCVVVRTSDPKQVGVALASVGHALHGAFPRGTPSLMRMTDVLARQYRPWQLGAALFTVFGVLALIVAALGIYSSVSYLVAQRTHEIGVRIALGADAADVLRHVIRSGVRPVLLGTAIGIVLAVGTGRFIGSLLYGISPSNPALIAAIVGILITTAMLAAFVPGWRATKIDPVRVMAAE